MANQQSDIYNAYVERTERNNVNPGPCIKGDAVFVELRANIADFDFSKPYSYTTNYWDNDSRTKVFKFDDGRIAEYATDNSYFRTPLLVIFEQEEDWSNYQRAMGMFHYLYT
jgi:hypothetical protein